MKLTTEQETIPTRTEKVLRWTRRLLFLTGTLALGYVGFTLLDAHLYQVSAKRYLATQLRMEKEPQAVHLARAMKQEDMLRRLDVPRLGLSVAVLQGTSSRSLRLGAGHLADSALPGDVGNTVIAGHRDTFFRELKDVRGQDEIHLQMAAGLFRYRVDWMKVVEPGDISVLSPSNESELTLVTCYPFYFLVAAPQRFVVRAHRY